MNSEYGCNNSKLCRACLLRDNHLFSEISGCTPNTYSKFQFAIAIITERASCSTVFCLRKDKPYLGYPVNKWSYKFTNALRLTQISCTCWHRLQELKEVAIYWHLDSAKKSSLIRVTTPHGHIPARIPACMHSKLKVKCHIMCLRQLKG